MVSGVGAALLDERDGHLDDNTIRLPIPVTDFTLYHHNAWHNEGMKRTTIMADEQVLDRLRAIAHRDRVSLAEVIRQGLELRIGQQRQPRFIGAGSSKEPPHDIAERAGDMQFEPRSWR